MKAFSVTPSSIPGRAARWLRTSMLAGLLLLPCAAPAANQTVTSLADSGPGSLREAINAVGVGESITFAVTGTIELTTGNLLITDHVTIIGPGASSLTVTRRPDAPSSFQIFRVTGGANVEISGLSITKGLSLFEDNDRTGGAIGLSTATLTLEDCAITDNQGFDGGGITNRNGSLTVRNCLFARNRSVHGQGSSNGGGILGDGGTTIVENSTFFDNRAQSGGGIDQSGGSLTVTHCTFSNNLTFTVPTLRPGNCIFAGSGAVLTIGNTILQSRDGDPALSTPLATVVSNGYNLCSDGGGGLLTGPGDKLNTDAMLNPAGLENHGGPTLTIALLGGSPAVDQGKSFGLTTDQRGQIRPRDLPWVANASGGDGSDIGAFESIDFGQPGQDFSVNTTDDHDDGIAGVVDCTLREAILRTNALAGPQVITFAANLTGTITLDSQLGQLDVTGPVTLAGPGARKLSLSGANGARPVLAFAAGSTGSTVFGLTVRNGQRPGSSVDGAGMVNLGRLTVTGCAFTSNAATGFSGSQPGQSGGTARGGAVFNGGILTLEGCSFSGNSASGGNGRGTNAELFFGAGGGAGLGGAVCNDTGATLSLTNCTFFNNTGTGGIGGNNTGTGARSGNGGRGFGGVYNMGSMTMTACTLSLNTGTGGAGGLGDGAPGAACGGLAASGGASTIRNTIIAGNSFSAGNSTSSMDAFGTFTSQGWNLIGRNNGSTGFTATGDQAGTLAAPLDPGLGNFLNNGGPTDTFLLLAGSPASDKGRRFGLDTDQRNLPRSYDSTGTPNASGGDGTDIGAVEMQPAYTGPARLISITRAGPIVRVVLQGTPFVNYQFQQSAAVTAPFTTTGNPQTTDSIGQTEFTDFGPLPSRRFYRAFQSPLTSRTGFARAKPESASHRQEQIKRCA